MSTSSPGSVTEWIAQLKSGDQQDAAGELWQRFFHRLAALAASLMASIPRRLTDHEQVAVDAFLSLLRGVENNRFPDLHDRDDLWQILLDLTEKQSIDQLRFHGRRKREWRRTEGESAIGGKSASSDTQRGVSLLESAEPTPDFTAACAEHYQRRLAQLDAKDSKGGLRRVAVDKLYGYSNDEIAQKCNVSTRTIERRLRRIRDIWESLPE